MAVFDAPIPEIIPGSDLLRLTPASVLAHTYCLNEAKVKDTLAPITQTVFIGPPSDCKSGKVATNPAYVNQAYYNQSHGQQHRQTFDYPQQQPVIGNGWGYQK
ncbi:hypothetical protein PASE110613_04615 [Paenibacillus sediminis]|uniref:Uncharacterized protein n=1 Tax=Paenibacillus sediminis TaxID=664909 RepID=A0ABS4H0K2_9BACL|nr:hypothetical protein [Paenibacillus sediminis]